MKERVAEWWRLWWDEIAIGTVTTLFICGVIYGAWHLFQITPARLEEGVVVDPGYRYTAQYEEDHSNPATCTPIGKGGSVCVPQPDTHHVHCIGGCFELRIDGCSQNRRGDTICREEWITVHQTTYDNCRIGQLWHRDAPSCDPR